MTSADDLPPRERVTLDLVRQLMDSGNLHPLIGRLREGDIGPESARDALLVLADLDSDLLCRSPSTA